MEGLAIGSAYYVNSISFDHIKLINQCIWLVSGGGVGLPALNYSALSQSRNPGPEYHSI